MANNKKYNQLTAFSDRLMQLKSSVTEEDRKGAMQELKVNFVTVSRYLNGKGPNLDTAAKLYQYFKKCIQAREEMLGDDPRK